MSDRDERLADAAPPASTLVDLLRDYTVPAGYYDEVRDPSGNLRPHWAAFTERTGRLTADDLSREQKRLARQLQENGVTYNIHSAGGPARVWSLDVLPHIVPASEWADLSAGLRQRARLLEAVVADIYGPQTLLDSGLVPAPLVLQHPGFLRQVHGIVPAQGSRLHVLAFDIARDAHGRWLVIGCAHASAVRSRICARESPQHLAAVSRCVPRAAGGAARAVLPHAARDAARERTLSGRHAPRGAADARSVHRDLFRALRTWRAISGSRSPRAPT